MARTENDRNATVKNVASTLIDTTTTASLVDGISLNTIQNSKTAIIRGLEAGPGITLEVKDADNGRFTTEQKKVVISASGGSGEANTASNIGSGVGLFDSKSGIDLQFKSLIAGTNIAITDNGNDLTIDATSIGEANTASSAGGASLVLPKSGVDLPFKGLSAGSNISLTSNPTNISISVTGLGTAAFADTSDFATSAQGTLADTAVQPGDNISVLTNDSGYLTTAVTSITAGTGLDGGVITTIGTISLADTTVTPGSYTNANITVDQQGRITSASNGSVSPVTFKGALVIKTSDQNLPGSTSNIILSWDSEVYNTDTIHDNIINNSRLTIPTGSSYAKIKVAIQWQSGITGNLRSLRFRKNGSTSFVGNIELNRVDETGAQNTSLYAETPVLSVVPGDYFEVEVDNNDATPLLVIANNATWFSMEIIA